MSQDLLAKAKKGDRRALGRLLSLLEQHDAKAFELLAEIYEEPQKAFVVGITGPPGVGKSSLINKLVEALRKRQLKVGVVAVDPTSPFTGGALLGDRIRLLPHTQDKDVFVRSIGSRGAHGGLSRSVTDIVACFGSVGFDWIFVETVGVGQTEVDIMNLAQSVVVVLDPEVGDGVQAMKAGLNEIAHFFVVNKADHPGADKYSAMIQSHLHLSESPLPWTPKVLMTEAHQGKGIEELIEELEKHRVFCQHDEKALRHRKESREKFAIQLFCDEAVRRFQERLAQEKNLQTMVKDVASGKENPYVALKKAFPKK